MVEVGVRTHTRAHPPTHTPFHILLIHDCRFCVFCHRFASARALPLRPTQWTVARLHVYQSKSRFYPLPNRCRRLKHGISY